MNIKKIIREEIDNDMDFISEPVDYYSVIWDEELLMDILKGGNEPYNRTIRFRTNGGKGKVYDMMIDNNRESHVKLRNLSGDYYYDYTYENVVTNLNLNISGWVVFDVHH